MTSRPDAKAIESWLQKVITGALPGSEGVKYERYDALTVVDVTLETGSMLPHAFSLVRTSDLATQVPRLQIAQSDRHMLKFNYDDRCGEQNVPGRDGRDSHAAASAGALNEGAGSVPRGIPCGPREARGRSDTAAPCRSDVSGPCISNGH
jgi:hypothetical protein